MTDPSSATERVGRYQLLEPIGTGPNGSVSRAKVFGVAGFERQFAVKRFHPDLTALPPMAQSLSAAARSYGSLEHPRIARMSEFGVAQGHTFTAVEHVAGLDTMRLMAEAKLAGTTLAIGGALALISQTARAVGYAHGRGLSHLGLAPTNVIVTADGDVKVTDFGILAATMPPRPAEQPRLAQRIGYLAPEQIAGEAASAATDVFLLGVIAYELVTGTRAFAGDTPAAIAQAILTGPPPEPTLPRPIVRVLQRCLARSPFERFPDARALADALDAALRVAPVPGSRKDIGAHVKATLDRLAALNDGNMSGVLALHVGTGPIRAPEVARDSQDDLPPTSEFVRPDVPVAGPARLVGPRDLSPASTLPDLPKPMTTVAGLAPPPIPVPQGLAPPATPPLPPVGPPNTMLGIAAARRPIAQVPSVIPPRRPKSNSDGPARGTRPPPTPVAPPPPILADDPAATQKIPREEPEIDELPMIELQDHDSEPTATAARIPANPPASPPAEANERPTEEMSPLLASKLNQAVAKRSTEEMAAAANEAYTRDPTVGFPDPADVSPAPPVVRAPPSASIPPAVPASPPAVPASPPAWPAPPTEPSFVQAPSPPQELPPPPPAMLTPMPSLSLTPPSTTVPGLAPVRVRSRSAPPETAIPTLATHPPAGTGRRWPRLVLGIAALGVLGLGTWLVWSLLATSKPAQPAQVAIGSGSAAHAHGSAIADAAIAAAPDAAIAQVAGSDASVVAVAAADASTHIAATADATIAPRADAAVQAADGGATRDAAAVQPTGSSDSLQIASTPPGARVFIDGADQGITPVKLAGSADRHTVALLLAGHELYVAEVDGHGGFTIPLKAVTPPGGPAGIKVIKCKDKDRYYVFVDGKPTGMTCPTERIECDVGAHTVEVYDVVTETRRKWDIQVKDTRLSYRVRVD